MSRKEKTADPVLPKLRSPKELRLREEPKKRIYLLLTKSEIKSLHEYVGDQPTGMVIRNLLRDAGVIHTPKED